MSVDFRAVGQRIKKKRTSLHLTQDNLAEKLSVTVGYISQIERGVTKVNLEMLSEIALELRCDLAELVTGVIPEENGYLNRELSQLTGDMNELQINMLLDMAKVILNYTDDSRPAEE